MFFLGWFGIRKSFSQFLLSALPCLQGILLRSCNFLSIHSSTRELNVIEFIFPPAEYGNIGYHTGDTRNQSVPLDSTTQLDDTRRKSKDILNKKCDQMKPVVPIISIDLPD